MNSSGLLDRLGLPYHEIDQAPVLARVEAVLSDPKPHPGRDGWDAFWAGHKTPGPADYLNRDGVFRYDGRFVGAPADTEKTVLRTLMREYLVRYVRDGQFIAEFGCGAGGNLVLCRELFPNSLLLGADWSPAAVDLVARVAATTLFDMTRPRPLGLQPDVVLTSGSMEQLGDDFRPFVEFMLETRPAVAIHFEPIIELYDESVPFDQLAIRYHRGRGYLGRFLTELRRRESLGACTILEATRTGFGNIYNDGYMMVVWKPTT